MTDFLDSDYLGAPSLMRLRSGEDLALEQEAATWLAISRQGVTALSDKRDYLTKDQLNLRYKKEVLNQNGVPDESLMRGIFKRAHNGQFGSRPGRRTHLSEE